MLLEGSSFSLILPDPGLVFWTLVIFIILWTILGKFAFKPIAKAIKAREASIDEALKSAAAARKEFENLQSEREDLNAKAKEERQQILKEAREVKDQIIEEARVEASQKADKILADAKREMEAQRSAMMEDVRKNSVSLAIEIAEKVLRKELDNKDAQEKLASELAGKAQLN